MPKKTEISAAGGFSCPLPLTDHAAVLLAHGGGGKLTHQLVKSLFAAAFRNETLDVLHDGAMLQVQGTRLAFSTDSYVVRPLIFPGGTIGDLAVNGTVNDLAMCGARPVALSAAFIIEEGLAMEELWRIVLSMQAAARSAGVEIVTGDTKVVDRGKGDKLFITTTGIGLIEPGIRIDPSRAAVGDKIIVSGSIAEHGIAIMSVREDLGFETEMKSDTAPLNDLVAAMLHTGGGIHVLRDPTRGGLASVLNEIAEQSGVGVSIRETAIPVSEAVKGACELLGLDPLFVACEGRLVAFVAPESEGKILQAMRSHPLGRGSAVIGEVVGDHRGLVMMKSSIRGTRIVDMMSGEQLPRIC